MLSDGVAAAGDASSISIGVDAILKMPASAVARDSMCPMERVQRKGREASCRSSNMELQLKANSAGR
jgi:hypothetical protein